MAGAVVSCPVCWADYDRNLHRPFDLGCHCVCQRCYITWSGPQVCPTCRAPWRAPHVQYELMSALEALCQARDALAAHEPGGADLVAAAGARRGGAWGKPAAAPLQRFFTRCRQRIQSWMAEDLEFVEVIGHVLLLHPWVKPCFELGAPGLLLLAAYALRRFLHALALVAAPLALAVMAGIKPPVDLTGAGSGSTAMTAAQQQLLGMLRMSCAAAGLPGLRPLCRLWVAGQLQRPVALAVCGVAGVRVWQQVSRQRAAAPRHQRWAAAARAAAPTALLAVVAICILFIGTPGSIGGAGGTGSSSAAADQIGAEAPTDPTAVAAAAAAAAPAAQPAAAWAWAAARWLLTGNTGQAASSAATTTPAATGVFSFEAQAGAGRAAWTALAALHLLQVCAPGLLLHGLLVALMRIVNSGQSPVHLNPLTTSLHMWITARLTLCASALVLLGPGAANKFITFLQAFTLTQHYEEGLTLRTLKLWREYPLFVQDRMDALKQVMADSSRVTMMASWLLTPAIHDLLGLLPAWARAPLMWWAKASIAVRLLLLGRAFVRLRRDTLHKFMLVRWMYMTRSGSTPEMAGRACMEVLACAGKAALLVVLVVVWMASALHPAMGTVPWCVLCWCLLGLEISLAVRTGVSGDARLNALLSGHAKALVPRLLTTYKRLLALGREEVQFAAVAVNASVNGATGAASGGGEGQQQPQEQQQAGMGAEAAPPAQPQTAGAGPNADAFDAAASAAGGSAPGTETGAAGGAGGGAGTAGTGSGAAGDHPGAPGSFVFTFTAGPGSSGGGFPGGIAEGGGRYTRVVGEDERVRLVPPSTATNATPVAAADATADGAAGGSSGSTGGGGDRAAQASGPAPSDDFDDEDLRELAERLGSARAQAALARTDLVQVVAGLAAALGERASRTGGGAATAAASAGAGEQQQQGTPAAAEGGRSVGGAAGAGGAPLPAGPPPGASAASPAPVVARQVQLNGNGHVLGFRVISRSAPFAPPPAPPPAQVPAPAPPAPLVEQSVQAPESDAAAEPAQAPAAALAAVPAPLMELPAQAPEVAASQPPQAPAAAPAPAPAPLVEPTAQAPESATATAERTQVPTTAPAAAPAVQVPVSAATAAAPPAVPPDPADPPPVPAAPAPSHTAVAAARAAAPEPA